MKNLITVVLLFVLVETFGQEKRALTHQDYDTWESVTSDRISKNGKWVSYEVIPQEGDGKLEIVSHSDSSKRYTIPRASKMLFSHDDQFAMGRIVPEKDSVRALKLKRTKREDMPKDSLFILQLENGKTEKLSGVKSYATPQKKGNWLAVQFEKGFPKEDENNGDRDSTKVENTKRKDPKKSEGSRLLVRNLNGDKKWEYDQVKNFGFSIDGDYLYLIKAEDDTLKNEELVLLDLNSGDCRKIDAGKTEYISPRISKTGRYVAYIATADSEKVKKPYYDLYLYDIAKATTQKIAEKNSPGILPDGRISKSGGLFFSEEDTRLYFGTSPDYISYSYEEDTTILDEERVRLDIWGWQDADIQPMQLRNRSMDRNRSYLAVFNLKEEKLIQIGDESLYDFQIDPYVKHEFALATDGSPYRRSYSWDIQVGMDLYLVNLESGEKSLVQKDVSGYPQLSPEAKYAYWYDNRDSSWVAYDVRSREKVNLTQSISVNFYNELHDSPSLPSSYGSVGWLEGDEAFLIYDQYDIWKIDPSGREEPFNITLGEGRKNKIQFRRERMDRDEEHISLKKPLILNAFHKLDKRSGYFLADIAGKKKPKELFFTDHRYFALRKADEGGNLIVRRSTYNQPPEIYASDEKMESLYQLSCSNLQQEEMNWGTVELVDFLANDGSPLQGLLFKPENFDESKKYPMMVYFYERNSDELHNYRAPVPSASIINIPFFVSNDYLVFVPDIKYELGLPGPSAYNCVIPGVQSIIAKGFVDAENMGIQGQSWGGYQVAYLITQTNMFKAAGAGAPVVNMTSAYGGIRWGTGMSRMFQYEQTQSRIGGSLWDKPQHYIENSPLFYMDRVNTPVLIMHNDADGSVPWYQGIEMFMALKRLNKPSWLLQYNGEDHNLRERKNRKDLSIRMSQFFDHYLKAAPAPLWMTDGLPAIEKGRTLKYELEEL